MTEWVGSFEWRGVSGSVQVECVANDDPRGYGSFGADTSGYPVCTATVRYPRRGYDAMFGWVQVVRSTDNESAGELFEPDPLALFADAHCWYGTEPTLFDAPSRMERVPMSWLAYSFLATTPIDEMLAGNPRRVVPLLGFEWGFDIRPESIACVELRTVGAIQSSDWEAVVPVLREAYPSPRWTFAESF